MEGLGDIRHQFELAFDFNWDVERKLGEPDRTARMGPFLGPEHAQDEIGEAVDDGGLTVEPGRRVDHAKDSTPTGDALEIAQFTLEASQDCQTRQLGGRIRLLNGNVGAHLSQRVSQGSIGVGRAMAGNDGPRADDSNEGKGQSDPGRHLQRLRQYQSKLA